jgi:D-tyrosyl-tRNA(Tyr) deacylase
MRLVIQRVTGASVTVSGAAVGSIGRGLVVLIGIAKDDSEYDADYLIDRVLGLRIFPDADGKMNVNVMDSGGALLLISQFTLYGDCTRGRRPSFDQAAPPARAAVLYNHFVETAKKRGVETAAGVFQAHMQVSLVNDGPVTILMDSAGHSTKSHD